MKNFAEVEAEYVRRKVNPDFDWERFAQPSPINPLKVAVSQARVAIVATAGAYVKNSQPPFRLTREGDSTFREIPGDIALDQIGLSHVGYDTRRALQDPNVVFPLDRLREAHRAGRIGSAAPRHFSFMGYSPQIAPLQENAREVARRLATDQVDLALLVPA